MTAASGRAPQARSPAAQKLRRGSFCVETATYNVLGFPPGGSGTSFTREFQIFTPACRRNRSIEAMAQLDPANSTPADRPGDDFRKIAGIGPVLERRLHDAGIVTYQDLAARSPEQIAGVAGASAASIASQDWTGQARQLAGPPPAQIPPDLPDFVGQEVAVAQVQTLLNTASHEAGITVVITGLAGVGKSALAIHMAYQFQARFQDGQLYANLAYLELSDILAEFLQALGIQKTMIPEAEEERVRLYHARLTGRRILVVLDSAKSAAQVRPLLPTGTGCASLITSRSSLQELEGAHLVVLNVLSPSDSLELLNRVVGPDRVTAELAEADKLVRVCGYLPLAIQIAGAWLARHPTDTVHDLVNRLESQRDDAAEGLDSLGAAFTVVYRALSNEEARLLRLLGLVTAPDFDAPVAAALLDSSVEEARDLLGQLQAYSLVEAASDPERYDFHPLIRLHAREHLQTEESEESRQAAATRLQALPSDRNRDQVEWVTDSPATHDLLKRSSLAWALATRLRRIQRDDPSTSFLLHLDGPWGAGKSRLLNLLRTELEQDWLIVNFDAWRQSKVGPPWWALLTSLRQTLAHEFRLWTRGTLRTREAVARIRRAGAPYFLALLILLLAAAGVFFLLHPNHFTAASIGDIAKVFTAILAAVGTIWAGALVAGRFLLWIRPGAPSCSSNPTPTRCGS